MTELAVRPLRSAHPAGPVAPAGVGRIPVLDVAPLVNGGRHPAKAVPGEVFEVSATLVAEGHGRIGANVVLRDPKGRPGPFTPMRELEEGSDRWGAEVAATTTGTWTFTVEAWRDPVATWRHAARIKVPAGIDVELMLEEGAVLLDRALAGVPSGPGRRAVASAVRTLRDPALPAAERLAAALAAPVTEALTAHPLREAVTASAPCPLVVHRERALFGSWYEFFPRSEGAKVDPTGRHRPVSGTLRTAAERLPAVAAMGFDVVYLPPVHPIGHTFRKGPGNTTTCGRDDPGSPWAIGSAAGGHDAIHPDLGTMADFDAFTARAAELGLEVALDFALQCSPDHPWVEQHPQWFAHRVDGSIAYAENPPKKYQDIYPIDFDADFDGLVAESVRLLRHWMSHGVRIFRVDNPHTKPVAFWERVLGEIARTDPDVLFLAEAFTRPAMMRTLAKVGFHQSYTYFTWRNSKEELADYAVELARESAAYLRPNLFTNTPDVLHAYLQHGGRHGFEVRAVLAATMSPTWGVYSGFELCEGTPAAAGSEEYDASEKYQLRPRDWAAAEAAGESIAPLLTTLNRWRRAHPALRQLRSLTVHDTDNDQVLAYSKRSGEDTVLVVVNLDPHHPQQATVVLDLEALGAGPGETLSVRDELDGSAFSWGHVNHVELDPDHRPAHLLTLHRESS